MTSTFVNDLRLNEMATGDQSGSWGTVTNTNLELIGDAFGFGTEAILSNANTHVTKIADGAVDAGRSMFLKYTGALDSPCTITISAGTSATDFTINKLWFIENATTGGENIIITSGSGADVTIPAGDVKVIYTNGAGSGGAVVDAFASLSVVDLKVQDDLTVIDDVDIGGALTMSGGGDGAMSFSTASSIKILDNNAASLVFEEANAAYMTFVTTNGSEAVKFDKGLDINAAVQLDSTLRVGEDGTGYDVIFFGDADSAFMKWNASADDLILGGAARLGIGTTSPNAPTAIVANTTSYEGLELVTPNGDASGEFHIGVHDNGGTGGRSIVFKRGGADGMDTESMRISASGNLDVSGTVTADSTLIAGLARSNTVGACAFTVDPSDTTVTYGFRVDVATNSFNIDRVDNTDNLLSIDSLGNVGIGGAPNNYSNYTSLTLNHATNGGILDLELNGNVTGELFIDSAGFHLYAPVSNDAITFRGNDDGGGQFTALSLDMSDAGTATFTSKIIASKGRSATNGTTALEIFNSVGMALNTFGSMYSTGATMIGRGVEPKQGGAGFVASITANTTRSAIQVGANTIVFSGAAASNVSRGAAVTMTDRMTIKADGNIVVSSTAWDGVLDNSDTNVVGHQFNANGAHLLQVDVNSTGSETIIVNNILASDAVAGVLQYRARNGIKGSLNGSGSGLAIANASDYRKKENITDLSGSLAKIKALRPVTFTHRSAYTTDTSAVKTGMIAHEVAAVLPNLVVGEKDAVDDDGEIVLQALSYSGDEMITHLIGAIKELEARITALEA